ncbi:MAG: oligosaccharide flippase family protein [Chloroflexi bacterium]|nr:oligosaccharide flippase family protein [Chloroflexota bacterium]
MAESTTADVNSAPPGGVRRELTGLLGRSGTYALSDILKQAINFLLLPLYTAYLTTADYGALSIALAAAGVLEVVYGLGLRSAVGRLYFDQRDEDQVRAFAGTLALFLAAFGVAMSALLLVAGPSLWPLLGQDDVSFSPYIVLVLLTVPLNNLGLSLVLPLYYVRAQAVRYAAFSLFSFAMVTGATVLFVVGLGQGAAGALWGRWLAAVIVLVPTVVILRRNARPVFQRAQLGAALAFSLPLVPHLISAWALNFSDRIILGKFATLDDVGLYSVGYQFGLVVSVLITGINNAWTPWYFRVSTRGSGAPVPRFVTYYVMLVAALGVGAALLAREAVRIMTAASYHDAWVIVPLVVLGYTINGLVARFMDVLLLHKRTGVVPLTTIAAGVANIAFNLIAIPRLGIIGAAYGTIFGYSVRLALTAYYAARTAPLPFEWGRVARVIGLALLVAAPGLLADTGSVWLNVPLKLAIFALFPLLLIGTGTLDGAERRALADGWRQVRARLAAGIGR